MAISTTTETRYSWSEPILPDKTEVKAQHINDLREAADDLDFRLDDHVGKGGIKNHPVATTAMEGFMSTEDRKTVDEMRTHQDLQYHRLKNVTDPVDPQDAVTLSYSKKLKDSFKIREERYKISCRAGMASFTIDKTQWAIDFKNEWNSKYNVGIPEGDPLYTPAPDFKVVIIPSITQTMSGAATSDYAVLLTEIQSIDKVNDLVYNVTVNVTGMAIWDGNNYTGGHQYSCRGTGVFTFTVLGASTNMFETSGAETAMPGFNPGYDPRTYYSISAGGYVTDNNWTLTDHGWVKTS